MTPLVHECKHLIGMRRFGEAESVCRQILARNSAHPDGLHLLGLVAYAAHRYDVATGLLRRAIDGRRSEPDFHNDLGLALQATGEFAAAVKSFRKAVVGRPASAHYHSNLGGALKDLGDIDGALSSFRRAIALDPATASAHFGRALCLLLLGEFGAAWSEHEWRVQFEHGTSYISDPQREGSVLPRPSQFAVAELCGRRLLVLKEQGLGDELFFLRSAHALRSRGAWLAYRGSSSILPILRRSEAVDLVLAPTDPLPACDHTLLVGDLPLLASARQAGWEPPAALQLTADPAARQRADAIAREHGPGPYLAMTWRAGLEAVRGRERTLTKSVPVADLGHAVACWPGTILVIQRSPAPGEMVALKQASRLPVADLSAANEDLDLMLGIMSIADDYVGVSNTNMHLRAGLSRSARVLVPWPAEWRWTLAHRRSPWFPDFPLYRQDRRSGWEPAFQQLAVDLRTGQPDRAVPVQRANDV